MLYIPCMEFLFCIHYTFEKERLTQFPRKSRDSGMGGTKVSCWIYPATSRKGLRMKVCVHILCLLQWSH